MRSAGPTTWRGTFCVQSRYRVRITYWHRPECQLGKEGVWGLSLYHRFSNQSKQTSAGAEHSTARKPGGPGPSLLLVSYSARVPGGTCHRWPPGPRLHSYPLRMMGKSAMRPPPPAPKQPKGKGKRHTSHLPGKGGSKVLRSLIAAPSGSPSPRP